MDEKEQKKKWHASHTKSHDEIIKRFDEVAKVFKANFEVVKDMEKRISKLEGS